MKIYIKLLLFTFISIVYCENTFAQTRIKIETILKGEVVGRPNSKNLLLVKAFDDVRHDRIATIPIVDGEFEYILISEEISAYELIFEEEFYAGMMKPIRFFSENATVIFKLNDSELFENNEIKGGEINKSHQNFQNKIVFAFSKKSNIIQQQYKGIPFEKLFSEAYIKVIEKLKNAKTQEEKVPIYKEMETLRKKGLDKSELGEERDNKSKALYKVYINDKYKYIEDNHNIVSYSLLIDDLIGIKYNETDEALIRKSFKMLREKYPNHSYTKLGANLLHALKDLKIGGQYVNFIAPDIKGNKFELKSVLEKNKIVLLDLWATWCGPCIAKTRLAKPVYEKYKDKGFAILGVAGEHKTLDAYKSFIEKEKWEWQQLIELNKQNQIWEKYNVMNGGGGMFLITGSGEILAVNPSAEEVETILKERL